MKTPDAVFLMSVPDLEELTEKILKRVDLHLEKREEVKKEKSLNLKQAAAYMNMSSKTFYKKLQSGEFPLSLRHGATRKFYLQSELDALRKKL